MDEEEESSLTKSNDTNLTSMVIEDSIRCGNKATKIVSKNHIISAICLNYEEIIKENNNINKNFIIKDKFFLTSIPNISLNDYIKRIMKHTKVNISTLINAVIYIDNFCERKSYILCLNNIYLIVLSACFLSIKFNEDSHVNSKLYSKIGGIPVDKLIDLEYYLCLNLHFSLYVKEDLYNYYYDYFANYIIPTELKEGKDK